MSLQIEEISKKYYVRQLGKQDITLVLEMGRGNPIYYEHMHAEVTEESVLNDLRALPPGKAYEDKYYIGFFEQEQLVAVMDLIDGYPKKSVAYIGFFMMNKKKQGRGIGTSIIREAAGYLKEQGFSFMKLGYVDGNLQSEHFWKKNGFHPTGDQKEEEYYRVVVMQREL